MGMLHSEPARTAGTRLSSAVGITVYGCGPDEDALFRELSPRFGVVPITTGEAVSEATAELARGNRCVSVDHKTRISTATLLALSQAGVGYISTRSVGYDHIDVDYARTVGISVENIAYSPDSVADFTVMLMLMAVRHARSMVRRVDVHDYRLSDVRGRELRDLTIGVVGTGRIGSAVVDRLRGFGCRVVTCGRDPAGQVSLDELLPQSDIVTLHTPLNAETRHLLDRNRIARMKPGAFVINTGRGSLVDTSALVTALESGRLGGAALDVLEGEEGIFYADHRNAPTGNPFLPRLQGMPNVLISPHTAYHTDHALGDIVINSLRNCVTFESEQRHG
ncbi:lactate dehydrogenase [Actinokineospora globicatena]|nr:lactate dehydrogenase [Actinokineospora globicatena]